MAAGVEDGLELPELDLDSESSPKDELDELLRELQKPTPPHDEPKDELDELLRELQKPTPPGDEDERDESLDQLLLEIETMSPGRKETDSSKKDEQDESVWIDKLLLEIETRSTGTKKEDSSNNETDSSRKKEKKVAQPADKDPVLQEYYDFLAEKLGANTSSTIVWKGAAKNKKIRNELKEVVEENSCLGDQVVVAIAKLFSCHLDSEEEMKSVFVPTLNKMATTDLECFNEVAVCMLILLVKKIPENGISLVRNVVTDEVYYRLMGDAVRVDCEGMGAKMVKLPKLDKIMKDDQFREILLQDVEGLGEDGKTSWILILGSAPESVCRKLAEEHCNFPWAELLIELFRLVESKESYNPTLVEKAREKFMKLWGEVTTTEERKKAMREMKNGSLVDHKEYETFLDQIMSSATYQLDDLKGSKDEPCLLLSCPTIQIAVKLFQHTMDFLGDIDAKSVVIGLVKQEISDQMLAAIIREFDSLHLLSEDSADHLMYKCSSKSLITTCAELLKIVPNPRGHPFMDILEIEGQPLAKWLKSAREGCPNFSVIFQESDEKTSYKALEVLSPDLYAPNCNPDEGNGLHVAGILGFTTVCREILTRGFHRLLYKKGYPHIDINDKPRSLTFRPASMAAQTANFITAGELLQAMERDEAKKLFTVCEDDVGPEIDLHQVMDEATSGQGGRWYEEARKEGEWKLVPQKLEKREVQDRVDFLQTAMNATMDSRFVDLTILIQDQNGQISEQFSSEKTEVAPDLEEGKKKRGKTLYQKIARSDFEELKSHECFATLTNLMWIDYGIVQGLLFSLYLLFMTFLTTSLVLAAKSTDPNVYADGLDWFRLFCEIITLIWVLVHLGLEIYELGRVMYRSLKQHSTLFHRQVPQQVVSDAKEGSSSDSDSDDCSDSDGESDSNVPPQPDEERPNCCLAFTKDILFEYFLDWQNMLDDLAILCFLLIIPFRIADSDVQWVFAALTFMFHGLKIFKYAIMFQSVGEYVAILVLLIKRDVPQFVTVFLVIIFSLGGALYFALTGHYNENNLDTENNNDTSEVYLLWWTGIRILAEGSALTYYGPGGFNWLGILIYWLFLFIVVVVLLNILIAQFSKSYEEETERAQINVILTRTEIILKMEQSVLTRPFIRLMRRIRAKVTRNTLVYEKVERLSPESKRDEGKPARSDQVEDLQTQTTNLGLQLHKQIEGNSDLIGKSAHKVEEIRTEIRAMVKDTREALQTLKSDMDGKMVGLERAVLDTRRYVDEIKEILLSIQQK